MNATLMAPSNSLLSQDSTSLGQQLVGAKLLTQDELENVLHLHQSKGARIGESVIQLGLLTEDQLLPFISQQLGIPVVRLREGLIDPDVVGCIPKGIAERLNVIAMFRVRGTLTVAMTEPQNLRQIDEIERVTKLRVRPVFAFLANIERMVSRAYQDDFEVDTVTADLDGQAVEINADAAELDTSQIESMDRRSSISSTILFFRRCVRVQVIFTLNRLEKTRLSASA
jgi:hypothetical protein